MDIVQTVIQRLLAFVKTPREEWGKVASENHTMNDLVVKWILPLAALPALASLIGLALIGVPTPLGHFRIPMGLALRLAIFQYLYFLLSVGIMALAMDLLAPTFQARKDLNQSLAVATFSSLPWLVCGLLFIIPSLGVLSFVGGLFSLYLLYLGLTLVKSPAKDKEMPYVLATIGVSIVGSALMNFILAAVNGGRSLFYMGM